MRIGIDLGGTKIEGVVMDGVGRVLAQRRVPTPAAEGYEAIVGSLVNVIFELEKEAGTTCTVGLGTPGAVSARTGMMKNCNTTCLNGQPLRDELEKCLKRPIRIANDANCFALSEAHDGGAAGYGVVFGVIIGTGVGGGLIFDGKAHNGPNSIAGEWGHTPLHSDGPDCYCGHKGCIETYLSGPGLLKDYQRAGGTAAGTAADVVSTALDGSDAHAAAALDRYIDNFGRAVATLVDIIDPDAIVLGGGLSNIDRLYTAGPIAVAKYVFSDELRTPILRNKHGDASGVRGAAWLW